MGYALEPMLEAFESPWLGVSEGRVHGHQCRMSAFLQMTNQGPIPDAERLDVAMTAVARVALRQLMALLLALLAIDTTAILLLNALYDPDSLRHRHLWRPVLTRDVILSMPCLLLLYFSRSRADLPPGSSVRERVKPLVTRLWRILLWMALALVAAVETVVLAENLIFYQTLSLVRTPSQTLSLLYGVLIGLAALLSLRHTRASSPKADVPIELRTTVRSVVWHSLKRSAQFSAMFAAVFVAGAYVFSRTIADGSEFAPPLLPGHLIVLAVGYVVAGVLCGAAAGGLHAARERTGEIVRGSYALAEPLIRTLIDGAAATASNVSRPGAIVLEAHERARGAIGRMVQSRFVRLLQRHWVVEVLQACARQESGGSTESLERLIREKLVGLTIDDVRGRLRLMLVAAYALAVLLWWTPVLLTLLRE